MCHFCHLYKLIDMKNDYKDYTPEELRMQDYAEYYMQLYDYIIKEKPPLQELHNELCRLLVKIAEEYPESFAPNRDNALAFPKVKVLNPDASNYGKTVNLKFEVFVTLYKGDVDYESSTGLKGDDVFFLSLALWYEVCRVRDKLKLKGITYHSFEKEVTVAKRAALIRKQQEALLKERREEARDLPAHFSMTPQGASLHTLLVRLKNEGWVDERTREEDWLYRLTGQMPLNGYPSQEPLLFSSLNQCRYIVKHLIFRNSDVPKEAWRKVSQVFAVKKGDISRVQRANKTPAGSNRVDILLG